MSNVKALWLHANIAFHKWYIYKKLTFSHIMTTSKIRFLF